MAGRGAAGARPWLLLACVLLPACALLPACGMGGLIDGLGAQNADTPPGQSMTAGEVDVALQVFALLNQQRAQAGLEPLAWDDRAADAAYDHAVDMRVRSFYAHENPDGEDHCDRLARADVVMDLCGGENIALGDDGPVEVMLAWMSSESHRRLILAPGLTHVGVGVHTGAGGPWWVQDFFIRHP